jgi:hypothetical protein
MRLILNGLTTGDTQPYIINKFKSSVIGNVQSSTYPIPQTNRVSFVSNYARGIIWEVEMSVLANTHEQLVGYIQDLTEKLYPQPNALIPVTYYTDNLTGIYTAEACLITDIEYTREITFAKLSFSLLIPSGQIYEGNLNSATLDQTGVAEGIPFPWTFPINFGGSTGSQSVTNAGNTNANIDITFIGPGEGFTLVNQTTGKSFKIDGLSLIAGQTIEVNGNNQTVTQAGSSIYQFVTSDSQFIKLQPGVNSLALYIDSGATSDTKAVVTWYNTYVGI